MKAILSDHQRIITWIGRRIFEVYSFCPDRFSISQAGDAARTLPFVQGSPEEELKNAARIKLVREICQTCALVSSRRADAVVNVSYLSRDKEKKLWFITIRVHIVKMRSEQLRKQDHFNVIKIKTC